MKDIKTNQNGMLIVFEGIDGTGKTTQIDLLADELTRKGFHIVATREPTDGQYGQKIRQLFTNRQDISLEEELELFMADRREHVENVIAPALAAGKIVLTDRYYFSTAAYQGAAGKDPEKIIELNEKFAPVPDLLLLLVVPTSVGIHRIKTLRQETLNDFEKESALEKVSVIFESIKRNFIKRIDSTLSVADVHKMIMSHVENFLRGKGLLR